VFQHFGHFAARKRMKSAGGRYQCGAYVNGKICDNRLGVRRELLQ